MANPEIIELDQWQWVKVASNVTNGMIYNKQTGFLYYKTYRDIGELEPDPIIANTVPLEAISIFNKTHREEIKESQTLRDIYIFCYRKDGAFNDKGVVIVDSLESASTSKAAAQSVTAFGETSVAEFMPLTGWAFTYNINPGIVASDTDGVTGTVIADGLGHASLSTGTSATGFAKIETVRSSRYIPGVGGLVRFTALYDTPQEDSKQVVGLINGADGWAFGYNGTRFGILRKVNNVENWIYQEDWNINTKPDLDHTKGNVYQIKYQWLGYGMQYFYMENARGNLEIVHVIEYTNLNTETSILNPNLPLGAYVVNIGNTIPVTLRTPSAIAGLSGDGYNDAISTNVAGDVIRTVGTVTDEPVLAFRMSDNYLGKANRLFCQILRVIFAQESNKPCTFRAYINGTVNNGAWSYISEQKSPLEVNNTLTSYTLGEFIGAFPVARASTLPVDLIASNFRIYAGQQIVFTVSTNSTSDINMAINWKSFV